MIDKLGSYLLLDACKMGKPEIIELLEIHGAVYLDSIP